MSRRIFLSHATHLDDFEGELDWCDDLYRLSMCYWYTRLAARASELDRYFEKKYTLRAKRLLRARRSKRKFYIRRAKKQSVSLAFVMTEGRPFWRVNAPRTALSQRTISFQNWDYRVRRLIRRAVFIAVDPFTLLPRRRDAAGHEIIRINPLKAADKIPNKPQYLKIMGGAFTALALKALKNEVARRRAGKKSYLDDSALELSGASIGEGILRLFGRFFVSIGKNYRNITADFALTLKALSSYKFPEQLVERDQADPSSYFKQGVYSYSSKARRAGMRSYLMGRHDARV